VTEKVEKTPAPPQRFVFDVLDIETDTLLLTVYDVVAFEPKEGAWFLFKEDGSTVAIPLRYFVVNSLQEEDGEFNRGHHLYQSLGERPVT
jgi:hypothetical protein